MPTNSRLSAVEADKCKVSRLLVGLQWLYSDCLRVQHENVGGTWHVYLDVGEERQPRTMWRGSGRSMTACWTWPAHQEGQTLHLLQQQPWAQHVHVERTRNRAVKYSRKWMGPHVWSVLSPTVVHRDRRILHCTLDPSLGVYLGLEGEHIWGGSTPGRQWAAESEQGPRNRSVLSPTGSSPG